MPAFFLSLEGWGKKTHTYTQTCLFLEALKKPEFLGSLYQY